MAIQRNLNEQWYPARGAVSPRRKTASGGLRPIPRLRLSRWPSQPTDASGKNRPSYDPWRRVPHLPQSGNRPCPTGPRVNLGGGGSATGFLGIVGLSAGLGGGVSVPTASLPLVGDGSFRGTQFSGSGSITPLAGLGLFGGVGPNYSLGGSNGAAGRVSGSVTPVIQLGAGDGGGVEVTSDLNSPLSLSGAMGRIAAGVYGAIGARFEGKVSTNPIGCK
jgi:hypothetical protein